MVTVNIGTVIPASTIKSGTSKDRTWAFGEAKAEKGYDKITCWFANPDVSPNTDYKVKAIQSVTKSAKKYTDKSGVEKWADTYSITALCEPCDPNPMSEFATLDDSIPF